MKEINQYILEKFKISKNIDTDNKNLSVKELNDIIKETCLSWCKEFCKKNFDEEDFEINQNSRGEVLVYLYSYSGLDKESKKEKEVITDNFWKDYKDKNEEFKEEYNSKAYWDIKITNYGFKVFPNLVISDEDFKHTHYTGRK